LSYNELDSLVLLMVLPEWVPTVADKPNTFAPHGDFNCLKLPEDAVEKQNDYVMLSDVFPQDITQLNWL
jgi:hypothetical protein